MAETFDVTPAKPFVLHTPRGFIVFNPGKATKGVPEEYRSRLEKEGVLGDLSQLDHDSDGAPGGSEPDEPVSLSNKTKAQLLEIADDEDVDADESMTNAAIVEAIEAKRRDADAPPA